MGISGLLQFLKGAIQKEHLHSFANKRVAVDAMTWLHIGLFTQHPEVQQSEFGAYSYLVYAVRMIKLLLFYHITPVFVFDGRHLSNKNDTAERRQQARDNHQQIAEKLIKDGLYEAAQRYFVRAQAVTREMVCAFIDLVKSCGLKVIVAPGEADPQLAFLLQMGEVDFVISEDSDVIAFGATKVIYKLKTDGKCHYFDHARLVSGICADYTLVGRFNRFKLSLMCVLAGCDYVDSLKGVGPKKAMELVWKSDNLSKLWRAVSFIPKLAPQVTVNYQQQVSDALRFFLYYPVYDPHSNQIVPLTAEPTELEPPPALVLPVRDLRKYIAGDVDVFTCQDRTEFADEDLLKKMFKRFKVPKRHQELVSFEFKTPTQKRKRESEDTQAADLPAPAQESLPSPAKKPKEVVSKTPAEIYEEIRLKIMQLYDDPSEVLSVSSSPPPDPQTPVLHIANPFKAQPKATLFSPKFEIFTTAAPKPQAKAKGQQTLEASFQSASKRKE